jgi:hypothetical protein
LLYWGDHQLQRQTDQGNILVVDDTPANVMNYDDTRPMHQLLKSIVP